MSSDNKYNFVNQTMLTCIGNKRKLVSNISNIVIELTNTLSKNKLNILDGFSGSSVVSRELSYFADNLYTNDLELYSYLMAKCYLETPSTHKQTKIISHINRMNQLAINGPYIEGIITKLYAPKDTNDIKEGERCFYTHENALIIDTLRNYIDEFVEPSLKVYCLVPLLNKASIHANTSGVFKGFHKNNGIGCFGGKGKNALERIMKPIILDIPIWNELNNFKPHCYNKDINQLINELPNDIDLIYLDPPYNQHPYGSNYFMLNIIATNKEPTQISSISGIPNDWNKSNYNYRDSAIQSMKELIYNGLTKSKYILISYNDEGFITDTDWQNILNGYNIKKYYIEYDTYKGSRNLKERDTKVFEIMFLISLQ
jgi:adenine-specific DNA-methyltransferase